MDSVNVAGSDIPKYDPGSTGSLRLWDASTARGAKSIADGGSFIPDGVGFL